MEIKLIDLATEIIKLADERPSFNYTHQEHTGAGCSYVGAVPQKVGGEGCIVGQALMRLGVSEESLRKWEDRELRDNSFSALYEGDLLSFDTNDPLVDAINGVQDYQDTGAIWASATHDLRKLVG